jgi:L-2-hydroxycarboxylate dehydrogenase (NAD+)
MGKILYFRAEDLKNYMVRFFIRHGVPEADAALAAEILLAADMRGVDSHGIIRLDTYYGSRLRKGLVNPLSPVTVLRESATTLALDGGTGLGQVVSHYADRKSVV